MIEECDLEIILESRVPSTYAGKTSRSEEQKFLRPLCSVDSCSQH